jgi:hypothetical protein
LGLNWVRALWIWEILYFSDFLSPKMSESAEIDRGIGVFVIV